MADDEDRLKLGDDSSLEEGDMGEAEIDYNVMGSFPASDPPSWTLGISPHKKERSTFDEENRSINDPSHQNETDPPEK